MTEQKLIHLKNKIEKAKTELVKLEGQEKLLLSQLKEGWECETIEEAESVLKEKEREKKALEEKIQRLVEEIRERYSV